MTTPGFRTVYIGATDEPGIHPPCQIGHPDRQGGGEDFTYRRDWDLKETDEVIRLWNNWKSPNQISRVLSAKGIKRSTNAVEKRIYELRLRGVKLRPTKKGNHRVRGPV